MSTSQLRNRRLLIGLWIPVVGSCALLATLVVLALTSDDPSRVVPVALGLTVSSVLIAVVRQRQKRRVARLLQAADPTPLLRSFAAAARRAPYGEFFAAANSATILALYGRCDEAEQSLAPLAWQSSPPFIQAQEAAARAVIAYVRGTLTEGLDFAVTASEQGVVDSVAPGSQTAELAFRTYRNVGLALSGRATSSAADELRGAHARLPLIGQVLAAWGLAAIARRDGNGEELQSMQRFLTERAPYCEPVLRSVAGEA